MAIEKGKPPQENVTVLIWEFPKARGGCPQHCCFNCVKALAYTVNRNGSDEKEGRRNVGGAGVKTVRMRV